MVNMAKAMLLSLALSAGIGYLTTYSCDSDSISYVTGVAEDKVKQYQEKGRKVGDSVMELKDSIEDIVQEERGKRRKTAEPTGCADYR